MPVSLKTVGRGIARSRGGGAELVNYQECTEPVSLLVPDRTTVRRAVSLTRPAVLRKRFQHL